VQYEQPRKAVDRGAVIVEDETLRRLGTMCRMVDNLTY
jgi:hypothetical protein